MIDNFWTINTYVFLDLETTGLIKEHSPMPKVTELAMVAVSRDNFLSCDNGLPRVLHKLVLPINPGIEISTFVENMTSKSCLYLKFRFFYCKQKILIVLFVLELSNESLKNAKGFNQHIFESIKCFLEVLKKPICLVSHNGNRFDFPILCNEMKLTKQVKTLKSINLKI